LEPSGGFYKQRCLQDVNQFFSMNSGGVFF